MSTGWEKVILQMDARAAPKQETYVSSDGLQYCGNCHTPVQCRVKLLGTMRTVHCLCQCQKDELQRRKEEEEARIRMEAVRRLKSAGIFSQPTGPRSSRGSRRSMRVRCTDRRKGNRTSFPTPAA